MKVAAYIKSYPRPWEPPGMRPEEQRARVEQYVAEQGWDLVAVLDDSGPEVELREHPHLDRLLSEPGEVEKLVVASLDRVGHRPRRMLATVRRLKELGIGLVCLDQGIDTAVDAGGVLESTVATLAHWQPFAVARQAEGWDPERIRAHGFAPATLVDVGAAWGTPPLYEAFDQAYLVLMEPLAEYSENLVRLTESRPGEYHQTAVGSREGTASMKVDKLLMLSSIMQALVEHSVVETREVPVTTIDRLAAERDWADPLGLKIDTEGYEQQVIEGAAKTLPRCEFVIIEASVHGRYEDDPTCLGLIEMLRTRGFDVCDVLDTAGTESSMYMDLMFDRRRG
jgi:FkbM family methyltransferase